MVVTQLIELDRIEEILERFRDLSGSLLRANTLDSIQVMNRDFPIYSLSIGNPDPKVPTLGLFGGVHGLERIGTHVVVSFLEHLLELARWDRQTQERLEQMRIVAIPLVNPAGMFLGKRSNPNDVDLMRDAPVQAVDPAWMLGGHRWSRLLPWYMGPEGKDMERESRALVDFVKTEMFQAPVSLALDVHSGFGARDRLWYPYAKTKEPFPDIALAERLAQILDATYSHHIYLIEPQSVSYTTHGDLWDYLYDQHREQKTQRPAQPDQVFIPWTLEMGSWIWIRKNPPQIFSALGPFNPVKPHRHRRTMRRHIALMDFFMRAVLNPQSWITDAKGALV